MFKYVMKRQTRLNSHKCAIGKLCTFIILMLANIAGSLLCKTKLEEAYCLSFNDLIAVFGETPPSWEEIETWSEVIEPEELTSHKSFTFQYHEEGVSSDKQTLTVTVNQQHLAMAKQIKSSFVEETTWESFTRLLKSDSEGNPPVIYNMAEQKVERGSIVKKQYTRIKDTFARVSGNAGVDNTIASSLDGLTGEGNEVSDYFKQKFLNFANPIIAIMLTLSNILFLVQTAIDIIFLSNSTFRQAILKLEETSEFDKPTMRDKAIHLSQFLVSTSAVKACGYKRSGGFTSFAANEDFDGEPKIAYWVFRRLITIISCLTYFVLLIAGMMPQIVISLSNLVLKIYNWFQSF